MLNFLIPYRAYFYGLAFVLLAYTVYTVVVEPRLTLKATKEKLKKAEQNISVSTANNEVTILDELNQYDANQTQIKIDKKIKDNNDENFSINNDNNATIDWVFLTS